MKSSHFSPDTLEFMHLLHEFKVRYLIVGGEASFTMDTRG